MTKNEFAQCMALLEAAANKPMPETQTRVYFDFLGDLPVEVLAAACKRAVGENEYQGIPPIGKLKRLASELMEPDRLSAEKAWELAWRAACNIDPSNEAIYQVRGVLYDSQAAYAMSTLPEPVQEAVRLFGGMKLLANSEGKFARKPFMDIYDRMDERARRPKLLAPLSNTLASVMKPIGEMK